MAADARRAPRRNLLRNTRSGAIDGPPWEGAIVNIASICGLEGCVGHPHYSAAKAGILGFTRAVTKELIVQGIRVNAVAHGFVGTGTAALSDRERARIASRTPIGRHGRPREIAAAVAFLASDDASFFFVGETVSPNGGLVTADSRDREEAGNAGS